MQQQKVQEAEQRKVEQKQKQILQSRALVAQAVAEKGSSVVTTTSMLGDEDEFEGAGIDSNTVPDDNDDMEIQQQERDAWEVRELIRILDDKPISPRRNAKKNSRLKHDAKCQMGNCTTNSMFVYREKHVGTTRTNKRGNTYRDSIIGEHSTWTKTL